MNELPQASTKLKAISFADDCTIYLSDKNTDNRIRYITIEVNITSKLPNVNKHTFESDKTQYIISQIYKLVTCPLTLNIIDIYGKSIREDN